MLSVALMVDDGRMLNWKDLRELSHNQGAILAFAWRDWQQLIHHHLFRCRIEQQLKTDQGGACMPDTRTPFQSTNDACKRLIRYHVFNEQLLSQQDLEKADEFFEATAKHLLDKFRQMMNKYRYLLLMESMVSCFIKLICYDAGPSGRAV